MLTVVCYNLEVFSHTHKAMATKDNADAVMITIAIKTQSNSAKFTHSASDALLLDAKFNINT